MKGEARGCGLPKDWGVLMMGGFRENWLGQARRFPTFFHEPKISDRADLPRVMPGGAGTGCGVYGATRGGGCERYPGFSAGAGISLGAGFDTDAGIGRGGDGRG